MCIQGPQSTSCIEYPFPRVVDGRQLQLSRKDSTHSYVSRLDEIHTVAVVRTL